MGVTALALYLCWAMLQPFVNVLIWSIVLVIVFYPVHRRILARTKKPSLSAFLSLLLILATVVIPLLLISTAVANQMADLAGNVQNTIQEIRTDPAKRERFQHLYESVNKYVNVDKLISTESLKDYLGRASQTILSNTINVLGGALGFIVSLFFILFTMYYLFRDGHYIVENIPSILPLEEEQGIRLIARTQEVITASVSGVIVIALVQGTLGGLMFWILGISSSLLWGVLMTLCSTIPMAGAFIVWVPAALFFLLTGHWVKALILTLWGILVIGMADNILRPRLVGQKTRLHELFIFFSVLGGLKVFGVLGILLGPVVVAITLALVDVYRQANIETPEPAPAAESK